MGSWEDGMVGKGMGQQLRKGEGWIRSRKGADSVAAEFSNFESPSKTQSINLVPCGLAPAVLLVSGPQRLMLG